MSNNITRRDFLNGVSLSVAGAAFMGPQNLLAGGVRAASGIPDDYYPPTLAGLRGSHQGAFEVSHALAWRGEKPSKYTDLDEEYDLIVVGAGISGLAAAYLYQQQAGKNQRILLLDNHDDFGGHAKRNEFHYQGQILLGVGGSGNFENPHLYSDKVKNTLTELGFDLKAVRKKMDPEWPLANRAQPMGMYMDRLHFGRDVIVNGRWLPAWHGVGNYQELVDALPIPESERKKLLDFIEGNLPLEKALPSGDIRQTLSRISAKTFLTDYVGLSEETSALWTPYMNLTHCVGLDSLSLLEGFKTGLPGVKVLGPEVRSALAEGATTKEHNVVWMPDGNASLTRQMVRRLIPRVAPGTTLEDLIDVRFDYSQLDRADHPVRLRLNSSVVNAVNNADGSVSISYVNQGDAYRVKAKHCILACYNGLIPHLCPELPEAQKQNLNYGVKGPMISVSVLLRNGRAFYDAGSQMYLCPTSYFKMVTKAPPANVGNYKSPRDPGGPMVVYMLTSPTGDNNGNQTARDIFRSTRHQLYTTSFEDYEKIIRDQLTGMFGATGFDADRDIEAITVNRWSHGYAYKYKDLYDPKWPEGEAPHELGRKQFGRISIANSDSLANAHLEAAIDAAWRAVKEQLSA